MSNSVLEALKRIDTKSTATKWVIPEKKSNPTPPVKEEPKPIQKSEIKPEPEKIKETQPEPEKVKEEVVSEEKSQPQPPSKEEEPISEKLKEDTEKIKEETENLKEVTEKFEVEEKPKEEEIKQEEKSEPVNTTPQQKVETKAQETTNPQQSALNRRKSEPASDFKKKLEEIHSTANRPGVLAQHNYEYKEQERHASYTQLKKKSTWAGPEPKTFGQKVDWLGETGEFHYYQYKQPERKNYNDYSNSSNQRANAPPPSERSVGVDKNAVPSKSKFSALLAVYNNGQ